MAKAQPEAAVLIIGNEILSGRTIDKNAPYIAEKLFNKGVKLVEIRVIPDIEETIIDAVRTFSKKYDYVFSTGGIGPTHDDITAEAMAKAFGVDLELNAEARDLLRRHYGSEEDLTDARLRMARIPAGAELVRNPVSGAPGFKVENVYVMAGVPSIMQAMLDQILPDLADGAPTIAFTVTAHIQESAVADVLGNIQKEYPQVDIGSYPFFKKGIFGTSIVLRGIDQGDVEAATQKVEAFLRTETNEVQRAEGMS